MDDKLKAFIVLLLLPLSGVWSDDSIPRHSAAQGCPQLPEETEGHTLHGQEDGDQTQANRSPGGPAKPQQAQGRPQGQAHQSLGDQAEVSHPSGGHNLVHVLVLVR